VEHWRLFLYLRTVSGPAAVGLYLLVVFCDGSTRFLHEHIHPDVLNALGTRAGGEVIDASAY
jgi:hypothetical protein